MRRTESTTGTNKRRSGKLTLIDAGCLQSWTAVCDFLENFPGCQKEAAGGREVVRVAGKVLAYLACNERSRPGGVPDNEEFVIVRIDFGRREHLLELSPESFFVTPHYKSYPGVIVRLSTVDQKQLRDLLVDAWRLVAPKRLVRDWDAKTR
ncbi:MAG: MmcQ/YjbR family DNA-binding protein [Acidobacteriaceae bacterium]|nr:MmcQ/YjbR family DNA-binding protein [Acidobacteriaceae bacterium]